MRNVMHHRSRTFLSHLLALGSLAFPLLLMGQALPVEQILLHSDRDLYLSGEQIWFKGYAVDGESPAAAMSTVLYVELHSAAKQSLARGKYRLQDGQAQGSIDIPATLPSGVYYLRAYTRYLRNAGPAAFVYLPIRIVNPETGLPAQERPAPQTSPAASVAPLPIRVQTDRAAYAPGEALTIRLESGAPTDFSAAELSLSVVKKGTHSLPHSGFSPVWTPPAAVSLAWLPETRDLAIAGQLRDKATGKAIGDVACWVTVMDGTPQVHHFRSEADGAFFFSLNEVSGKATVALTTAPQAGVEAEWLIQQDYAAEYPELPSLALGLDSSDRALLESLLTGAQVAARFPGPPGDTLAPVALPLNLEAAPTVRLLRDFVEIPNLKEVFQEIVTGVQVRQRQGKTALSVFDEQSQFTYDDPLILLDNLPVFDVDALLGILPERVARIEVFPRRYVLGDLLIGGMVRVYTVQGDLGGMAPPAQTAFLRYDGLNPAVSFPPGKYTAAGASASTAVARSSRWPDFRSTLCWLPDVRLSQAGTTLTCFAGDAVSEYEVVVQGTTAEGARCEGRAVFWVR